MYNSSIPAKRARAEGRAEEIAKGRAEGIAEGIAKGRTEGIAEGRAELLQSIIATFKTGVVSLQTAAQCAGMSESEFEALCAKN